MTIVLIPVLILAAAAVVGVPAPHSWGGRRSTVDDELSGAPTMLELGGYRAPESAERAVSDDGLPAGPVRFLDEA